MVGINYPQADLRSPEIEYIFHPRSIAVVGASTEPEKQGYRYVELLQEFSFKGDIYPVNPKAERILGIKAFPSLREIPSSVDYVITTIPASGLPQLIEDCSAKGAKVIQMFTARLGETGKEELIRQERELVQRARKKGIRVIGPNCMGIYYPREGLSFRLNFPKEEGVVAFISQSAGHSAEVVYRGSLRGIRFSKVINYGNGGDLNETDFIRYFASDPETKTITAYIEGVKKGQRFLQVLSKAAEAKPVIILKGGRSEAGAKAVASHTGSLAGSVAAWNALCQQSKVVQAYSIDELVDLILPFVFMPPPEGRSVGVLGGGGGGSVASADDCAAAGLEVSSLPQEITMELKHIVPEEWDLIGNPIDLSVLTTGKGGTATIPLAIKLLAKSHRYQVLIFDVGAEWYLERPQGQQFVREAIEAVIEAKEASGKPIAVVLRPGDSPEEWRWKAVMEEQQRCLAANLAVYPSISRAARALGKFVQYYNL